MARRSGSSGGIARAFRRRRPLAGHFAADPADQPSLAAVASRRVAGTDHPAASRPELVADVARWIERSEPGLLPGGRVDEAVDRVLVHVELLVLRERGPSCF